MSGHRKRIDELLASCAKDNWDGYHAHALTPEAAGVARRFLDSLFIGPTNGGGLVVAWLGEAVSVELGADGRLVAFGVDVSDANNQLAGFRAGAPVGEAEGPPETLADASALLATVEGCEHEFAYAPNCRTCSPGGADEPTKEEA